MWTTRSFLFPVEARKNVNGRLICDVLLPSCGKLIKCKCSEHGGDLQINSYNTAPNHFSIMPTQKDRNQKPNTNSIFTMHTSQKYENITCMIATALLNIQAIFYCVNVSVRLLFFQNWAPAGCEKLGKCLKVPTSSPWKCEWPH